MLISYILQEITARLPGGGSEFSGDAIDVCYFLACFPEMSHWEPPHPPHQASFDTGERSLFQGISGRAGALSPGTCGFLLLRGPPFLLLTFDQTRQKYRMW
ncbi:hypothetical protein KIL84_002048 [Mauremys mutica]|uniref:Uncharacterized protein n=1 Tax=Mauremys mutica TaxID=74926 RepID=A0A9D3XIA0_9SAUR|nr:hypothetical protein KIL84_002048 [Mauremys mutica]